MNKQFLRQFFDKNHDLALINTAQGAIDSIVNDPYAYANSAEHQEGITAFLHKRTPQF
jgi:enoyl-CoA hydratase